MTIASAMFIFSAVRRIEGNACILISGNCVPLSHHGGVGQGPCGGQTLKIVINAKRAIRTPKTTNMIFITLLIIKKQNKTKKKELGESICGLAHLGGGDPKMKNHKMHMPFTEVCRVSGDHP